MSMKKLSVLVEEYYNTRDVKICKQIKSRVSSSYFNVMKKLEGNDLAYFERNQCVRLLSQCFYSYLARHPISDTEWERDWMNIVVINLPTGQASWHIRDSELKYFTHLSYNNGYKWDGHTNDEKYRRMYNA